MAETFKLVPPVFELGGEYIIFASGSATLYHFSLQSISFLEYFQKQRLLEDFWQWTGLVGTGEEKAMQSLLRKLRNDRVLVGSPLPAVRESTLTFSAPTLLRCTFQLKEFLVQINQFTPPVTSNVGG